MSSPISLETCQTLTELSRQLLEANEHGAQTLVMAKGHIYRVLVSVEPVPEDKLSSALNHYL